MGQTRMFRDRVVSMEQTLEGGEKHLAVLKELCREALPELEFREHTLDHERDLFVMEFQAPGGARSRICWTRMVLFDAERIPTLAGDPASSLRTKIIDYLRSHAGRPEVVVTFRHLEEGWVDTPEPRREGRRRRRGGRGSRGAERGDPEKRQGGAPDRRPAVRSGSASAPPKPSGPRGPAPARPAATRPAAAAPAKAEGEAGAPGPGGKRRRRFRRRRRGRGPGGGPPNPAGSAPSGTPRP